MTAGYLLYATFALVLQMAAALLVVLLDLYDHAGMAMGLHGAITTAAVVVARVSLPAWRSWSAGTAAAFAVAGGALTGFMRTLCIVSCPPGTPFPSMLTWIAIDGAISAGIVLAAMAVVRRP